MNHPSPYELLSGLDHPRANLSTQDRSVSTNDLRALAAQWSGMQARPSSPAAAPPTPTQPAQQAAPAKGPLLRTPPPMYPPTAYPTGVPSYNAAPQPTRHAYYDAILEQHRNAAKRAVFVDAQLE